MPEGTDPPAPAQNEGGDNGQPAEKMLSQTEVDRIVQDRLARERGKYGDYDDLKAKAAKLDEIEQANASELEKAVKRAEEAESKAKTAGERADANARRAAVVAEATKAGAVDPDAVLALLAKDAVTVGDDGQVTGAEEAVKALLEAKPYLVGSKTAPKAGSTGSAEGGARGGDAVSQLTRDDLKTMSPKDITKAKAEGRLRDVLSGKA